MQWSLVFAIVLFIISLISTVLEIFEKPVPFLSIFPELINSSSGFLSVLCLIAIVAVFRKYKDDKKNIFLPNFLCILDLIIINKLYLNTTWSVIIKWIRETFMSIKGWNWSVIAIIVFSLTIAIGGIIWGILILKKSSDKKKRIIKAKGQMQEKQQQVGSDDSNDNFNSTPSQDETLAVDTKINMPADTAFEMPSLAYLLICIFVVMPVMTIVQFICYRILPLDLNRPTILDSFFDVQFYMSTVCIGIIVALFLWIAKKRAIFNNKAWELRRPAVLALIAEMIIFFLFFFRADLIDGEFLNSFLNKIMDNTLIAVIVIPIVLFVILDIGISLFINIFFEGISDDSKKWQREAQEKIDEIQRRIVMFVLNIFLGILNLFLFIPDFFNEIGELLLSKEDLFPNFEREKDKNAPLVASPECSKPSENPESKK